MSRMMTDCEGFHRRDFLRVGAAGILGLGLPDLLRLRGTAGASDATAGKKPATGVIQIWLSGGPATIDMWDLKPGAPEEIRGEFRPIATAAPGVSIGEHMPGLAKVMDRCVLVRSLGHTISAHGPGTTYMATGNRPSASLEYPALGSLAARMLTSRRGVPPYVRFASMSEGAPTVGVGYLGPASGAFEVEGEPGRGVLEARGVSLPKGMSLRDLEDRDALRAGLDRGLRALDSTDVMAGLDGFHREAIEILRSDRVRSALDLSREPDRLRDRYGRTTLGQGALAARRLIEAGAVRHARVRRLGHARGQLRRPPRSPATPAGPGALGPDRRPRVAGPPGRDHHRLRRRVRAHAPDQRGRRARPLVALDGRAAGRRRLPRRVRPRLDRSARHGTRHRPVLARRRRRHDLPAAGHRPTPRDLLRQRAADRHLPRGEWPLLELIRRASWRKGESRSGRPPRA